MKIVFYIKEVALILPLIQFKMVDRRGVEGGQRSVDRSGGDFFLQMNVIVVCC